MSHVPSPSHPLHSVVLETRTFRVGGQALSDDKQHRLDTRFRCRKMETPDLCLGLVRSVFSKLKQWHTSRSNSDILKIKQRHTHDQTETHSRSNSDTLDDQTNFKIKQRHTHDQTETYSWWNRDTLKIKQRHNTHASYTSPGKIFHFTTPKSCF